MLTEQTHERNTDSMLTVAAAAPSAVPAAPERNEEENDKKKENPRRRYRFRRRLQRPASALFPQQVPERKDVPAGC